jgi:HSP20 family protein
MNIIPRVSVRRDDGQLARRAPAFDTLQREIDRVFDAFSGGFFTRGDGAPFPSVDVAETDREIKVSCELPGLEEKDVQVSLVDNVLTIRGEKRAEHEEGDKANRLVERSYGAFSRAIELPAYVEADQVKATMKHGVLKITAPKTEGSHVKRIDVRPGA